MTGGAGDSDLPWPLSPDAAGAAILEAELPPVAYRAGDPAPAGRRSRHGAASARSAAPQARWSAHLPYLVVVSLAVASVAWAWQGGTQRVRGGTLAMGGALAAAALARLVLPEGRAGMLASRGRFVDVVTLAALAVGLLVAGLMLPTPS